MLKIDNVSISPSVVNVSQQFLISVQATFFDLWSDIEKYTWDELAGYNWQDLTDKIPPFIYWGDIETYNWNDLVNYNWDDLTMP